ncbi:tetratricopeptide repeat protein 5-like [Patiria miniata]|uniref:Tetratricopeptide repeat protein 5 OB fold domain-containing protein n=1 Tax=Patiria miniata TaxID=46514 RepID=A0A914AW95_PATMI|nr:tetratricopeptide repeat protein 5-like [Patiria miniata]
MAANEKDEALGRIQKAVEDLYAFRDHFFEKNSIDRAIHKTEELGQELKKVIELLDELQSQIKNRSEYMLQRGKALNVLPDFSPESLECLSKAVKLDPRSVEAWNQLGECYWKNKDVEAARNCFTGALNHSRNKVSLRNLSMVMRQLGKSQEERSKFIQDSVDHAKEAVQMDYSDGTSWFIAGNAYLTVFFNGGQKSSILKQCLGAYSQAEKDTIQKSNPDLYFNRATIFKFQEDYQASLDGYRMAQSLDPTWPEPKEKLSELVTYLQNVTQLVQQKGKLKAKRLQQLLASIKETDLGPYGGGSYTPPKGDPVKLELMPLSRLAAGPNPEKVVHGKVVCSVATDEPIPFTFAMVDAEGSCFAVNIYNIAKGQGVIIGDSVAVPEPFVQHNDFVFDKTNVKFSSIRVDTPVALVVNGKKLGLEKQAPAVVSLYAKSE